MPKLVLSRSPRGQERRMIKEYKETHQYGIVSIENTPKTRVVEGDFGIQIAKDGRVWVCINGIAFMRFKPLCKGGVGKTGSMNTQSNK